MCIYPVFQVMNQYKDNRNIEDTIDFPQEYKYVTVALPQHIEDLGLMIVMQKREHHKNQVMI